MSCDQLDSQSPHFVMESVIAQITREIYIHNIWLLFARIKHHFPLLWPRIHSIMSIKIPIIYFL